MTHTLFYDDNNWSTLFDSVGGGGLMSNVDDLISWDRDFYSNKLGKGTLVRELERYGVLNNRHHVNYGLGLGLREYRGLRTVEHSGGTFGYRTELMRFPEERFTVTVLGNVANADVDGLGRKVSDLYLEKRLKSKASESQSSGTLPDPASFGGTYLDLRTHTIYTFTSLNGTLWRGVQNCGA